jgi:hypothetical protein
MALGPQRQRYSIIKPVRALQRKAIVADRHRFEALYRMFYSDAERIVWCSDSNVHRAAGVDALIFLPSGQTVTVAEMIRDEDYGDMLIEVFSDARRKHVSHETFQAQFIAYAIVASHEAFWIPAGKLIRAFGKYLQSWIDADQHYPRVVPSGPIEAWYVAVPWRLVANALDTEPERMIFPW